MKVTPYRYNDDVLTQAGSRATFQHHLPAGYAVVWIHRSNWKEPTEYPNVGPTASLTVDVNTLRPQFMGVRK